MTEPVKLIMTGDIYPGREQEYFEFIVQEFIPALQQLGLEPEDAWFTVYGDYPQILATARAPSLEAAKAILNSPQWKNLERRLKEYITNYRYKLVPYKTTFQFIR